METNTGGMQRLATTNDHPPCTLLKFRSRSSQCCQNVPKCKDWNMVVGLITCTSLERSSLVKTMKIGRTHERSRRNRRRNFPNPKNGNCFMKYPVTNRGHQQYLQPIGSPRIRTTAWFWKWEKSFAVSHFADSKKNQVGWIVSS